jgi:hypothetical protein
VQTTLLGLSIAFIIALLAALIGPYFIDWNQFRPQFEAEATRVVGAPVRVRGELDARLLPTPSLRLRSVAVGGANDLGKVRADKLDVEFSLSSLMRGEWRATELSVDGMAIDLGLDSQGRIDWPASAGRFNLGTLAIDRVNLTGRVALHDAASRGTLELNDITFSGDVRSLAGAVRGDGSFMLSGSRYPFRISSGQSADASGTRVHLNIDPGALAFSADLDGVLNFDARAPRFEGAMVLGAPTGRKTSGEVPLTPWRISAKIKVDPSVARLEQVETSYGPEESALKLAGQADLRFGASPLLHAVLSARQLDADRFFARDNSSAGPIRLLPALRALTAGIPRLPIPAEIEFSSEQIMLAGRPVQNLHAELHTDSRSWTVDRLDFRAPGTTRVEVSSTTARTGPSGGITGAVGVESSDPDTLVAWLQGRSEVIYRSQKPLRLRGDVSVAPGRVAIEAMQAEIDGGAVEGRIAVSTEPAGGSRLDATLKAERLDLDAASALARSLAGPRGEWPDEAQLSLDIERAISAGRELHPLMATLSYGPNMVSLDRLKIGESGGVMLEGGGHYDRVDLSGKLEFGSTAASVGQISELVTPFAPSLAPRLAALGPETGPLHIKLSLDLATQKAAGAPVVAGRLDLDAPDFKGHATVTAQPSLDALRGGDLDALGRTEFSVESQLASERGPALLALLGLDRAIGTGDGPAQFEGSVTGVWQAPLRLSAKLSGIGLDAEAQGTAEPWAEDVKASINLRVRKAGFAPLFDLKPTNALAQNVSLSSRVSLAGGRLSFDDIDGAISGSRLRGRVALTLGRERNVEGEIGLDALEVAPAFALALGAAGHDAADPLGAGLLKGWQGRLAFQALRAMLPGGAELRPLSGIVRSDGQSLSLDGLKGRIGGGEVLANVDARQGAEGLAVNARVQLSGVDGAALRYRALAMPTGRVSMQMTLSSQGRSASALAGALSGSGTVTLESADIAGLDPRAFDTAIRASDSGEATDDARLRQIVEPVLSAGALSVKSAQIPFNIRDGRLRVGATALDAKDARAIVSGGYDIPADQADIRAVLASTATAQGTSRPEIQLFAAGSPDALARTVDVAALSSWLAVRAIDRETRRLDSIERGDPLQAFPASIPAAAQPALRPPEAATPEQPLSEVPVQRRPAPKPRVSTPRPAGSPNPNAPVLSQHVAPLPPPIEVRPAPGAARSPKWRPRPPLMLVPPMSDPPRSAF